MVEGAAWQSVLIRYSSDTMPTQTPSTPVFRTPHCGCLSTGCPSHYEGVDQLGLGDVDAVILGKPNETVGVSFVDRLELPGFFSEERLVTVDLAEDHDGLTVRRPCEIEAGHDQQAGVLIGQA